MYACAQPQRCHISLFQGMDAGIPQPTPQNQPRYMERPSPTPSRVSSRLWHAVQLSRLCVSGANTEAATREVLSWSLEGQYPGVDAHNRPHLFPVTPHLGRARYPPSAGTCCATATIVLSSETLFPHQECTLSVRLIRDSSESGNSLLCT